MDIEAIKLHFSVIRDERQSAKIDYHLFDILFDAICAIIAGSRRCPDIREYVLGQHDWFLKQNLFEQGVPADDTFARLIAAIKPNEFHECFLAWIKAIHRLTAGEVVAIYGKTLRGSYASDDRYSTIHMVSAYASANQLVLGQMKTDKKSNEISAIPTLIKMLDLRGALVTIDAMACQNKIANTITSAGADYLLAVKGNQGKVEQAIQDAFKPCRQAPLISEKCQTEKHHGRLRARLRKLAILKGCESCYFLN